MNAPPVNLKQEVKEANDYAEVEAGGGAI